MAQKIPRPIGDWTARKLEHLTAYLNAFTLATTKARERYYIDAMAGCGECVLRKTGHSTPGSAWRALNAQPPFTRIHLIELDKPSADHLDRQMSPYPQVSVYQGDCNEVIPKLVLPNLSRIAPTLAFLDPTGVQPSWNLVKQLATHRQGVKGRKIELLILFAFDMFINRWLEHDQLRSRLNAFYGNDAWLTHLAESRHSHEDIDARRARFLGLYTDQLRDQLGYRHVDVHGPLRKGRRVLYHMIFATDHDDAQRIMKDVWKKDRAISGELFYQQQFALEPRAKTDD